MKVINRVMIALLVIAAVGMGVTSIIRARQAIDRSSRTIAQCDEFLRRYERGGR